MDTRPLHKTFLLLLLATFLAGCNAQLTRRDEYIRTYQQGCFQETDRVLSKTIDSCVPQNNYRRSNDAVWLLLDRATERFATGNIDEAIADYALAIEAIDYFNQDSTADKIGQFLLEDGVKAYAGEDFEQVLARVYFALALLHKGDVNNAYALLRQSEQVQQIKQEIYKQNRLTSEFELIDNPVAKYFLALLAEKNGDFSNSSILYQQTETLIGSNSRLPAQIHPQDCGKNSATVIFVGHNGNAPHKVSETSDASIASAIALEILLHTQRIDPAISSLTGIPVPALVQSKASFPVPLFVSIDGFQKEFFPLYNVTQTAAHQLKQQMPVIVARGVARFVTRRGAVAYASKQDPNLGALVDIAMLIANANTEADTRSWGMLPSSIDLVRYDLPAGDHQVTIKISHYICPPFIASFTLRLKPEDLCVINVFNIHPGVITVQIPERYLINKGEFL